jgi:hypothetical protein
MIVRLVPDAITHTVITGTIIYGRWETGFGEGRGQIPPEIELNDASVKSHGIC